MSNANVTEHRPPAARAAGQVERRRVSAVERGSARHTPRASSRRSAFTLIELLIAASLTAALLGAAWAWVWATAAAARAADGRAQLATAQGFAARALRADLERCVGLGSPAQGVCGSISVALVCRDPLTGADEVVTVAWDAHRGVLWRKAAGSYLAEGVATCTMRYFAGDGQEIVPATGVLDLAARRAVARVRVEWRPSATPGHAAPRLQVVDAALPVAARETSP